MSDSESYFSSLDDDEIMPLSKPFSSVIETSSSLNKPTNPSSSTRAKTHGNIPVRILPEDPGEGPSRSSPPERGHSNCVELLKTSKNHDLLALNGYIYYKNRGPVEGIWYWECRFRSHRIAHIGGKCSSRVVSKKVDGKHLVVSATEHSHGPDPDAITEIKYRNALKRRAAVDSSGPIKLMRLELQEYPASVQTRLNTDTQRKLIERARGKLRTADKEPQSLQELTIPDRYKTTISGDNFLIADCVEGEDRIMIFGSNEALKRLSEAKYWVIDATFDSVPGLFRQLLTIHASCAPCHKHVFPAIYVLMTSKCETLYRKVFSLIVEKAEERVIDLDPSVILSDFEKAIINSCQAEFPDSKHSGCFFHFSKKNFKHIQQNHLQNGFVSDLKIREAFKNIQALAFLPAARIPDAFSNLKGTAPPQLTEFFNYVETFYVLGRIRKVVKNGRVSSLDPVYPPTLWSVYTNILEDIPRTTNQIEGWHSLWNKVVGSCVGVFTILEQFRIEENYTNEQILAYFAGTTSKQRKAASILNDENLKRIVTNFDNYTEEDYLKAVSTNLNPKPQTN